MRRARPRPAAVAAQTGTCQNQLPVGGAARMGLRVAEEGLWLGSAAQRGCGKTAVRQSASPHSVDKTKKKLSIRDLTSKMLDYKRTEQRHDRSYWLCT